MEQPALTQFRIQQRRGGIVHLVFDAPDRSMNVFTNRAIHELGAFAEWLHRADVSGVVVRSGKASGFCAGADLTELGVAYDMIVAAPPADRFDIAFNHFFPLSHAIRRLETAGKPVVAAIHGIALGGGCELALGTHHRVATRSAKTLLGLPECGVGLLPGAGGTQRMPRLVGPELGLDVLLQGRTLGGEAALSAGLVDALCDDGEEVAVAEAWLLSGAAHPVQPWDRPGARAATHADIANLIDTNRSRELARMGGHEPAPLAILDCVELGFIQPIDGAIRSEMAVFSQLIQRREARNMIRTLFLGKQACDKAARADGIAAPAQQAADRIRATAQAAVKACPGLALAGFGGPEARAAPVQDRVAAGYWIEGRPDLMAGVQPVKRICAAAVEELNEAARLQLDHLVVRLGAIPAYLGGASGLAAI
jgi:3-hydroxyacyl-CoA dehydrogenase/enoyl-CoA hydratase/3-hydroxybutyryl-CoA epimerase